jgi:hypothetical protein
VTLALLATAASLLLSGCPGTDPADCNCPNLVEAASSIDWIGDGTAPDSVATGAGTRRFPREVMLFYEVPDIAEAQQEVEDRLRSFPSVFVVGQDSEGSVEFRSDEWRVYVGGYSAEGIREMSIFVYMVDDDERAAEILAPVAEVLGTTGSQ